MCVLCLHDHPRLFLLFASPMTPVERVLSAGTHMHSCMYSSAQTQHGQTWQTGRRVRGCTCGCTARRCAEIQTCIFTNVPHIHTRTHTRNRTHLYPSLFAYSSHLMHAHTPPLLTQRSPHWFWALLPCCQSVVDLQDATPR